MTEKRGKVYNKIYSDKEWALVRNENILIIEDFLEEYRQRQLKESTIKQYHNDLRIVMIYILRKLGNKSILDLSKKDFRRFSLYLTHDLGVSNARSNRLMSSVRSLLTYVEDDDEYDYEMNTAKKVKGLPKEAVRTNEDNFFLSFKQIMMLRKELIEQGRLQDAVLLMLMTDSAGRRNEIFQVEKHGLADSNMTNEVIGKRGKRFKLVYLNDTKELIKEYLKQRGEDNIDSLWYTGAGSDKRPITSNTLYDRIVTMSKLLSVLEGKNIQFFPHSLRHSRCEMLLQGEDDRLKDKKGKNIKFTLEQVKDLMNHESTDTTQLYAKDHTESNVINMFGFSGQ